MLTQMILTETMHVLGIKRPVRPVPSWFDQRVEGELTRHDSHLNGVAIWGNPLCLEIDKKEGRSTLLLLFQVAIFSAYTDCLYVCAAIARTSSSSC